MTAVVTASALAFELPNGRALFSNLNFKLETGLYSLVGPNGVGKTTLAKLIAGELEPSSGTLRSSRAIVYVEQRRSPLAESVATFLSRLGAYEEWNAFREKLLEGLDVGSLCTELSGGQWMRVRLASVLRAHSSFLILDEPTNDLDREGRSAILEFLRTYDGGVLLISHDREVLELSESVLELSNRGLSIYGVPWQEYLEEKDRERGRLASALDSAKRERDSANSDRLEARERQEKRNRKGKAEGASGSLPKILIGGRKRRAQVTTGKIDVETLERANAAVNDAFDAFSAQKIDPVMYAELEAIQIPSQKLVAEAVDFNVRYRSGDNSEEHVDWLYKTDLNFAWRGPARVAVKGANGSGKSTLLKVLVERLIGANSESEAALRMRGSLKSGTLRTMVLDQRCAQLNDDLTIFDNVRSSSSLNETEIRNSLARFLFTKDSVFQKVRDLSGGERMRAALAKGLLTGDLPELVILDEPTNNLDLANIEFLEDLLRNYRGALIAVSHDERFLEKIEIETELDLS